MTVEAFLLCDYAQDVQGKLTALGAFDTLFARDFPAVHPLLCFALRLRFQIYELGKHKIRIEIADQDGQNPVPPFEAELSVNGIGLDSAVANLALPLGGLRLEREAVYRVVLMVDGKEAASIPLYVRQAKPA